MQQLTYLQLSQNRFLRLPPAITLITTLNELNCWCNPGLQLEASDVERLAALPRLATLNVSKSTGGTKQDANLTEASVSILIALSKRLPHLKMPPFAW